MTTPQDVLTVTGARKKFGDVMALDGASLTLKEGELLALLGPNGAGKTTLIRAISGRVQLDGGEIRLFGEPLSGQRTPPQLGIVPQEVAIYPSLTARENLAAFARLQGVATREIFDRVAWALGATALADRADEPIKAFSGGMKRRLNIACGVLHRPRVVLLDEPTVGVDPQSRERIYDMLAGLTAEGVSLLLTTHHLEEAEARCSRTVIIDRGRVIADGTLSELVAQTVGGHRLVTLRLDAAPRTMPAGAEADTQDPRLLRARVDDVARDLPALLAAASASGAAILDVDVRGPSLQAVFIHLTGRELRE
ncbi:MAG TPA: ABC transporter ATP-binding protein [Vicinamibacterales bacterium]|jgi:ABC-2 type transport system ATP-binding protein